MGESWLITVKGLDALESMDALSASIKTAARIAINKSADSGRKYLADQILREVNFPASYVGPSQGRLVVKTRATNNDLTAVISARTRATSLAQFVVGNPSIGGRKKGDPPIQVSVNPGHITNLSDVLPGVFLMKLRAGSESIDTKFNVGLAIRTKNGRPPPGYKPVQVAENLYLLYGPSVAQAMYSEKNQGGVATDVAPKIGDVLETEFSRQVDLTK